MSSSSLSIGWCYGKALRDVLPWLDNGMILGRSARDRDTSHLLMKTNVRKKSVATIDRKRKVARAYTYSDLLVGVGR